MDQTTTRHRGPGRGLLLIALGTLAIAILAIALVVLRGDQQASYPTGSPEAAYQAFIVAAADRDADAAWALFSTSVQKSWTRTQFDADFSMRYWSEPGLRVLLDGSTITGERAIVHVVLEHSYSGGLMSSRYRETFDVRLVREAGAWRIDQRMIGPSQYW